LAKEEMKVVCDNNPVTLTCCSETSANWSRVEWKQEGKISIVGKNVN
jgi:G protein-coupled receptor 116